MEIDNILEICVAIDIAIIGIAYPIIVDKISNIGEKYSSEYLSILFNNEQPQRIIELRLFNIKISFFKLILYSTILTFLFLIINQEPLFGWDNFFINNSAKFIVLLFSAILTISFFIWLDKVALYSGKSTSLLKHIIKKYKELNVDSEIKTYYLKSINELTFYAVNKQDEHLQETLLDFYYYEFSKIRKVHDKSKPLVYPIDFYFLVNKLNSELINKQNTKLQAIEHRSISGVWLLGQNFENIPISEETYKWLWKNIYTICDNDKYVKMFWANSSQYFDIQLRNIRAEYDSVTFEKNNQLEIDNRTEERSDFLELHYALGGLLLYRENYKTIKYIFEYSQSLPPRYVLLPNSMTTIFEWLEIFRNEFKIRKKPIDSKYYFPELDNLGNRRQVNYWICSYLTVLFIRQYSLDKYFITQKFTSLPILPSEILELYNWLDTVSYFENCLEDIISNDELVKSLNFSDIIIDKKTEIEIFITNLKASIVSKIGEQKFLTPLSIDKIKQFNINSSKIIFDAFDCFSNIFNTEQHTQIDDELKISVNGGSVLMTKSAFTENDIQHINFDSFFAEHIANYNIKRQIPNSFFIAKTKGYLLNIDNIINGLEILVGNNNNIIIIGINLRFDFGNIISDSKFGDFLVEIPSYEPQVENLLFVLNKKDLPFIVYKDIQPKKTEELKLEVTDDNLKLYTSVIDINLPENIDLKDKWKSEENNDNLDLKVLLTIDFLSILYWKKERDIVQISIASLYKEQGIQNDLTDIIPLRNDKV
ncbi:MAG: hypothetical protein IM568_07540 [Flavobacterium sp.]|nr:hypothetical protein [Flavobacterium sp.]